MLKIIILAVIVALTFRAVDGENRLRALLVPGVTTDEQEHAKTETEAKNERLTSQAVDDAATIENLTARLKTAEQERDDANNKLAEHKKLGEEVLKVVESLKTNIAKANAERDAEIADLKKRLAESEAKRNAEAARSVDWLYSIRAAEKLAAELDRPVYIAFSLPDSQCPACVALKRDVYEDAGAWAVLGRECVSVWVRVKDDGTNQGIAERFGVERYPRAVVGKGGSYGAAFRPADSPKAFIDQLHAETAKLK